MEVGERKERMKGKERKIGGRKGGMEEKIARDSSKVIKQRKEKIRKEGN